MRKKFKKFADESKKRRYRKKLSIRSKISGTVERPRICAIKTNKHINVQVVNDTDSVTIFSLSTFGKNAVAGAAKTVSGAKVMGERLADELKKRGFEKVIFDRNGRSYNGILASLASGLRENGIKV